MTKPNVQAQSWTADTAMTISEGSNWLQPKKWSEATSYLLLGKKENGYSSSSDMHDSVSQFFSKVKDFKLKWIF